MADLMELNIVANVSSVKQAVSTVSRLEKQLFAAVKAIDQGTMSQQRFNKVLQSAKAQYKDYAGNAGLAAINVNKLVKEQRNSVASTNAAKAATEAASAAERKRLANIKEMKSALLAQKTAEEANTAALKSMKLGYDRLYSAEQKTLKLKKLLRIEIANGTMTVRQAGKELLNYRRSVLAAGAAAQQTRRTTNQLGVMMQQSGYQIGDFAVQVGSGQNAMVAFGQQATQLVGTMAMFAKTTKLIALFSGLGIAIPIITGIGAALMRSKKAAVDTGLSIDAVFDRIAGRSASISTLLEVTFSGPLEVARLELVSILGLFKELDEAVIQSEMSKKGSGLNTVFQGANDKIATNIKAIRRGYEGDFFSMSASSREMISEEGVTRLREMNTALEEFKVNLVQVKRGPVDEMAKGFVSSFLALKDANSTLANEMAPSFQKMLKDTGLLAAYNEEMIESAREQARAAADKAKTEDAAYRALLENRDRGIRDEEAIAKNYAEKLASLNDIISVNDVIVASQNDQKKVLMAQHEVQKRALGLYIKEAELSGDRKEALQMALMILQSQELELLAIAESTADAKEESILFNKALKLAETTMSNLTKFGDTVEKSIVKATAEIKALKEGGDAANASMIAGLKFELGVRKEIAFATAVGGDAQQAVLDEYEASLKRIAVLAGLLSEKDALKPDPKGKTKTLTSIQDTITALKNQTDQETKLLGLSGKRLKEEKIFYKLVQANAKADIKFKKDKLRAIAKEVAAQQEANEDFIDAQEKSKRSFEAVLDIVDQMSDSFSNFVASGLSDFKGFVSSIKNMFVKLLADMAAAALRNKILIPIATGMAAGMGSSAAASSMASGTGAFASGTMGASLAGGASAFGAGFGETLGMAATVEGTVAMAVNPTIAAIGQAAPYILAAIAVIGLFSKKTKLLDSGLRTTVEGFDVAIATFNKTQSSRLFGLLKGSKITKYEAASPDDAIPLMKAVGDLQQSIVDAAGTLGIGAEAFDKFSYEFKLSLQGLTEEQKIQKVNEEIGKLGDSFASMTVHFKTMNELMAVAQQRYDLTTRLLQLQGKEEELITRQRDLERSATHELNIETLEQIYALEDLARAVDETTGAIGNAAEALALQGRKLKALGDQEDILAFTRQNELDVVNELNKELLLEVHTLEDLALGLTNTKKAAEDAEKELKGFNDAVDAAASELKDLLDESLDAALGGLERAIDARKDTIDQKFDSLISGLEDRLSAAENTAQASSEIYQILSGALQGRSLSGASFAGREAARSYVSGGGTDADKLRSAVGVLAEPSAQLFGSFEEYARDFAITSNVLKQSKDVAEAQMTADEQAVELLKEQIEKGGRDRDDQLRVLDEQLEAAQLQIDTLKGIDVSIVSVDAAMKTVRDAMTTYEQTQANHSQLNSSVLSIQEAINNLAGAVGQQAAALAASAAATQAQADAANAANAVGMQVTTSQSGAQTDVNSSVAQTALSRAIKISAETPKTSAEQASLDRFTGGVRPDHIKLAIADGARFDPARGGYRHFASGGLHTGGLRMVGERGPELEVTSPSRIYSNSQTRSMMSNPELVTEIKELRKEISETKMEQRAASIATVKYNKRTSDQLRTWNSVGLPPERTA